MRYSQDWRQDYRLNWRGGSRRGIEKCCIARMNLRLSASSLGGAIRHLPLHSGEPLHSGKRLGTI